MRCLCTRSRSYHCKVVLLDEQELLQEIQDTSIGQHVLDTVFRHLNLIETAYFGLRYIDCNNQTHWLDPTKKVAKQLKGKDSFTLYFGVKFYAVDPCKLVEEITRYQFFLQIKQDILQGRLPVSFDLAAELGAYAVQSELGDYDPRRHSKGYVTEFRFTSNQTAELENKISELHKDLQGQLPAVAELNYLDKVKWLEMYGVDLHPVIGEDNVEYFLGLTPTGVIVLRNKNKVANYYWPTITKIYFKGKYFMLRVYDKNNEENTYGFETPSRPACKHLYKCCVEHHSFFRLVNVASNPPDVVNTRFNGSRADKLSVRSSQIGIRNPPSFTRTPSRRYQRRIVEGAQDSPKIDEKNNVFQENTNEVSGNNISAPATVNSFYMNRSDSPRSTRSAPWSTPWGGTAQTRPYSSHSPRSVRSAGPGPPLRLSHARRSSSVESQSSNDSRPCRRHKHRSKRGSDNESDMSKCSSHSNRRHRHRSRRSSGSEHDHHHSSSRYQLVESQSQWKEVQRRQAEGSSGVHQANVIRPRSGYLNSGIETESEVSSCHHHHHRRKHRKHRSRSRSPSDGGGSGSKPRLPDELKKHLEFQLVDTEGMSEDQLREIPYTIVKTNSAKAVRVRLSPSDRPKPHHSARRTKSCLLKDALPESASADSPPPPYSESPVLSDLSNKTSASTSTTAGTTVSSNNSSNGNKQNSSQLSSRLPSIASFSNMPSNHSVNSNSISTCSSSLYGNPPTLYPTLVQHQLPSSSASLTSRKTSALENNSWYNEASDIPPPHSTSLVGLPPQPHSRRNYYGIASHSETSLNSTRSHSNSRSWTNSSNTVASTGHEIRGGVGLPWTSISEQLQTTNTSIRANDDNIVYSCLDSPRRNDSTSNFGSERSSINQNILEHRSTGNNVVNYNHHHHQNQNHSNNSNNNNNNNNAIKTTLPPMMNTGISYNQTSSGRFSSETTKKSALAETGVLGSHSRTSNGATKAWPNDKQLGWQPKNTYQYQFTRNSVQQSSYNAGKREATASNNNNSAIADSKQQTIDLTSWVDSVAATGIATDNNTWQSFDKGPLIYSPQVRTHTNKSTSSSSLATFKSTNRHSNATTDKTTFADDCHVSIDNLEDIDKTLLSTSQSAIKNVDTRIANSVNKTISSSLDRIDRNSIERLIQDMTTEL